MRKAAADRDAERVVVGMDPHKRSVTIEVMAGDEAVLGGGRFATTVEGYRAWVDAPRTDSDAEEPFLAPWSVRGCPVGSAESHTPKAGRCSDDRGWI